MVGKVTHHNPNTGKIKKFGRTDIKYFVERGYIQVINRPVNTTPTGVTEGPNVDTGNPVGETDGLQTKRKRQQQDTTHTPSTNKRTKHGEADKNDEPPVEHEQLSIHLREKVNAKQAKHRLTETRIKQVTALAKTKRKRKAEQLEGGFFDDSDSESDTTTEGPAQRDV